MSASRTAGLRVTFRTLVLLLAFACLPNTVQAQSINLAWEPSVSSDVAGYTVLIGVNPGSYGQTIDVGNATSFVFSQAVPGTRYYFAVRAYTSDNMASAPSNEVSWKINVGPRLTEPASVSTRVGVATSVQLSALDDGDPLTYAATGLPAGLTLNSSNGRIAGTPTTAGTRAVTVTVSDGQLTATHAFNWTVADAPTPDSVSPATGSGTSQVFQFSYSDPLGASATSQVWAWFNATLASTSANSCLVYYDRPTARLNLINNAGSAWSQGALGTAGTLQNSQCTIALANSSAVLSGTNLTLTLAVTFSSTFGGSKNVYMYATGGGASSGWQTRGSWTIPASTTTQTVTVDSVSPGSGTGSSQTFSLQYSNSAGATGLSSTWVWFNATLANTSANSCLAYYDRVASRLYLINDAGTAWTQGAIGGSATLQNSQCSIALANSSVALNGNTLTLALAVTFRGSFGGAKNVYMYAAAGTRNTGWQSRGTWTIPSSGSGAAVSADSVAPNIGTGTSQAFSLQYSDALGATDLSTTWVWFNATQAATAANSCLVYYSRPSARLFLLNDAGTVWSQGTLGTSTTLQNTQCAVTLASSSAVVSGNSLMLNLAMTFRSRFSGTKNIYMYAASAGGANSGWQTRGSWTVPAAAGGITADSVSPNAGAGMAQTFALQYSDGAGVSDIGQMWVWFSPAFASTAANSCLVYYDRRTNRMSLINDAGTGWTTGTLGSGSLVNSQCLVDLAGSSVIPSGNSLTLNLFVTFRSRFVGAKNIYMFAATVTGANSGWQTRGSWTVQ